MRGVKLLPEEEKLGKRYCFVESEENNRTCRESVMSKMVVNVDADDKLDSILLHFVLHVPSATRCP